MKIMCKQDYYDQVVQYAESIKDTSLQNCMERLEAWEKNPRLLGNGLVRENLNPYLAETLAITRHCNTGGFNLVRGDPGGLQGLQAEIAVVHLVTAVCLAGQTAAVYSAVFYALRHQHYCLPPSLRDGFAAA